MMLRLIAGATILLALAGHVAAQETPSSAQGRLRVRDLGVKIGVYQPGPLNAITDVAGVRVGQVTLVEADDVRTGVTAILPHDGNMLQDRVAAAVHAYNAFGKLVGATQVNELGELETPVLLTNTLSVWDAARALAEWMLGLPGNQDVRSVNPVVGETNDGWLSDIRGMHVKAAHVIRALDSARGGPVDEGSVGAGTGTIALGWKGGIGTSSRKLPSEHGGFTLGVLVQSNFGGDFTLDGVPVWRELRGLPSEPPPSASHHGSCMIVVATDAPLDSRQLGDHNIADRHLIPLLEEAGDTSPARAAVPCFPPLQDYGLAGGCRARQGWSAGTPHQLLDWAQGPVYQWALRLLLQGVRGVAEELGRKGWHRL